MLEGELTESDVLRIASKLSKKLDKELEGKQVHGEIKNRILSALVKSRWDHSYVSVVI